MRNLFLFIVVALALLVLLDYFEGQKDPYEVGSHWDYSIICENGYKYKCLGNHSGTILLLNSKGEPLKCNETK